MGEVEARRRAAWRFVRAIVRSEAGGVIAGGMRHIFAIRNRSATDARVRDAIFAHALRLDASYHDRVGPGELMSRASSDSEHVARMMDAIGHTIGYVLTVVAVATVMLGVDA